MSRVAVVLFVAGCTGPEADPTEPAPPPPVPFVETADTADRFVRLTPWACFGTAEMDFDTDGEIDQHTYIIYDPEERSRLLRVEDDRWNDGRLENEVDYTYDDRGRRISEVRDEFADDVIEELNTWAYDDRDRVVESTQDTSGDGEPDWIEVSTYDGDDLVLQERDLDGDGTPDDIVSYSWEDGHIASAEDDNDGDGTTDLYRTYEYDAEGLLIRIVGDVGDGGSPEYLATWTYLTPTHWIREEDLDADGVVDVWVEEGYDERGNLTDQGIDATADGHVEFVWEDLVWDEDNRLVSGRLTLDLYVDQPSRRVILDYQLTYDGPTGPWLQSQIVEYRNEADGPITQIGTTNYLWTCP